MLIRRCGAERADGPITLRDQRRPAAAAQVAALVALLIIGVMAAPGTEWNVTSLGYGVFAARSSSDLDESIRVLRQLPHVAYKGYPYRAAVLSDLLLCAAEPV